MSEGGGAELELKLEYFEVPMMVKFDLGTSDTKPYLMVGPTIGFNMSAKLKAAELEVDIKEDIESVDFGVGFGAGVNVPMGNNSIFLEARYALGLTDIDAADSDKEPEVVLVGLLLNP